MRKVILYIAISLDGYIADINGNVEWLDGYDSEDSYSEFVKDIDTVIMGNKTYRQNEWIYKDFTSYVITHDIACQYENVVFYRGSPCTLMMVRIFGYAAERILSDSFCLTDLLTYFIFLLFL